MPEGMISITVNSNPVTVEKKHQDWTLVRYLREVLGLTGTKKSCDNEGTCGTCAVPHTQFCRLSSRTAYFNADTAHRVQSWLPRRCWIPPPTRLIKRL
jgi:aerobic-type carbon monoxide dehydrogenase small subunit (CoxS/CutS family)